MEESERPTIAQAASSLRGIITHAAGDLADQILGRPGFGTPEWLSEADAQKADPARATAANLEWHLTKIQLYRAAQLDMTGSVLNARQCGATWQTIADTCGMTRQAAHDRWAKWTRPQDADSGEVAPSRIGRVIWDHREVVVYDPRWCTDHEPWVARGSDPATGDRYASRDIRETP